MNKFTVEKWRTLHFLRRLLKFVVVQKMETELKAHGCEHHFAILSFSSVVLHREDNSNCDSDILTMPVADYSCSHCDVKLRSCIFGF